MGRKGRMLQMFVLGSVVLGVVMCCRALSAATGTLLAPDAFYPRLVRVAHSGSGANGHILASVNEQIFESDNDGKSFAEISRVPAPVGNKYRCCETLFEMPETVGQIKAGTLLFAATYDQGDEPAIVISSSTDEGRHWTYLATPVMGRGEKGAGGLWEPEFSVARDHALVMFWSDETFLCCSQKLEKIRTFDGATWRDRSDAVTSPKQSDRPGMIVVSRLPTGLYFMTYEICGDPVSGDRCAAYFRTSRDGWNYGDALLPGTRMETADGKFFEHAPTNVWTPSPLSPEGVIAVVGQVLHNADGSVAQDDGDVLFVNPLLDGSGPWRMVAAPVAVPNSYDNFCPNYSSALLPVSDGTGLLELASDYRAIGKCATYFGTKSWTAMSAAPQGKTH